jgi:hypothetical protein
MANGGKRWPSYRTMNTGQFGFFVQAEAEPKREFSYLVFWK